MQRIGVLAVERLEQAAIELFIDDEVAETARGDYGYPSGIVPGLDGVGNRLTECV